MDGEEWDQLTPDSVTKESTSGVRSGIPEVFKRYGTHGARFHFIDLASKNDNVIPWTKGTPIPIVNSNTPLPTNNS